MFDSVRFNGISFRYVIPAWRPECNCQAMGCWSTGESSERNETKVELSAEHRAKHNSLEKRWATLVDDKCACVWENELSSCISLSVGRPKSSRRARGVRSSDYSNVRSTGGWCIHHISTISTIAAGAHYSPVWLAPKYLQIIVLYFRSQGINFVILWNGLSKADIALDYG